MAKIRRGKAHAPWLLAGGLLAATVLSAAQDPARRPAPSITSARTVASADGARAALDAQFDGLVKPFIGTYCVECHSGTKPEAEFDLATYSSMPAMLADTRWTMVFERIESEEMPSVEASKFPADDLRHRVVEWYKGVRDSEMRRHAGDPGVVLARRLSHAEYNYTIRDLTGADIRPTREFPVDPANTAGFDNSGESLTMSPALLTKYLKAAQEVASHMFLRPEGFSFAPHLMLSDTDRDKYLVHAIIDFYRRQNTNYLDYFEAAWRYRHRAALGQPRATFADIAVAKGVSAKYLATLWSTFEGTRETVGPLAKVQAMWRALPAPGPGRTDTAGVGREALRDHIVQLRAKIEPRFPNLQSGGVAADQQPFMIWKNVQYATHRMTFDAAQLQVEGEPPPVPYAGPEPGARGSFGPGATRFITNTPGDPDLVVPAGQRVQYEAAFARFSRIFPDMFYMQERGRNYFDTTKDRGRYLDAGLHSLMGYFRDDQPLHQLILDEKGQAELDRLWLEMDVVGSVTSRMYAQFIENGTAQAGGNRRVMMPPNPNQELVTSESRIRAVEAAYLAAALPDDAGAHKAISEYFNFISSSIRGAEQARITAEPSHLDALLKFAGRAYRRPLTPSDRNDLRGYYRHSREDGLTHDGAMRETIVSVLMSPELMYRLDLIDPGPGIQPLSNQALASRLSYFLWSSMPDDELLARAAAGDLRQPRVLAAQARRMLRDPRAAALAVEFGGQWLDVRRFQEINTVDRERFPSFTSELRDAMFEEPVRFLTDVFRNNRSILDLLYARDTFVNPVLARHYGIPGDAAPADAWTHVEGAGRYERGGLLPMAAFLTKNAPGARTSPVKRGNWVVKNILGEHIPPPPPGVPELPVDEATLDLPLPAMMARHRADASCSGCHAKFDALGLVFEGFGPIGERRDRDLANRAIEDAATFPNGAEGTGLEGLRAYIKSNRETDFVDNVTRRLLAYALGRSLLLTDEPLVEDTRRTLAAGGYRFDALMESIVTSRQFLNKRARATVAEKVNP